MLSPLPSSVWFWVVEVRARARQNSVASSCRAMMQRQSRHVGEDKNDNDGGLSRFQGVGSSMRTPGDWREGLDDGSPGDRDHRPRSPPPLAFAMPPPEGRARGGLDESRQFVVECRRSCDNWDIFGSAWRVPGQSTLRSSPPSSSGQLPGLVKAPSSVATLAGWGGGAGGVITRP